MTRIFLAVLAIAFLLSPSGNAIAAHKSDHVCSIASEEDFYASVAHRNPKVMLASDKARNTIIDAVNADRKAKNMFLIEADTLVIGLFSESGMMFVGLVAFKDRCVVPGTVAVMEASRWVAYMLAVGVTVEDFTEIRNG